MVSDGKRKPRPPKRVDVYFAGQTPTKTWISLRGKADIEVTMVSGRLFVHAHSRKLHVIALRYEGEEEYRYIAATKLSWRACDIVRAYSMRWLVEVVIEDWKGHSGWGKMAFQRGVEGACRGVILSFVVDHFLCSHPLQLKQLRQGKPAWTAGSMQRYLQGRAILAGVESIISSRDPYAQLRSLVDSIESSVDFRLSDKHMSGHNIGEFGPSPRLVPIYKYAS